MMITRSVLAEWRKSAGESCKGNRNTLYVSYIFSSKCRSLRGHYEKYDTARQVVDDQTWRKKVRSACRVIQTDTE